MLQRLIRFALAQRLFVLATATLLAGIGWMAFRSLPIDAFPDASGVQVKIIMKAPGMTPEEVETRIAIPIETEMLGGNPRAKPEVIPIGRFGTPDEVADLVVAVAQNGYITGQTFQVNGGLFMT